jgi:hypothetical protein
VTDYIVFIGATPSLSTDLLALNSRLAVTVIAPAIPKREKGRIAPTVRRAIDSLMQRLNADSKLQEKSRLSAWTYSHWARNDLSYLWDEIGRSAWIELVPSDHIDKNLQTRRYIERRYPRVRECLHSISNEVFNLRRRSPFPLPIRNFQSDCLGDFCGHWYVNMNSGQLQSRIDTICSKFRQLHPRTPKGHRDTRDLFFAPARNEVYHGIPHPIGSTDSCFLQGRYRFGAALYPGFHYDVSCDRPLLSCTVYDCDGRRRDLGPERRSYINIFPNDHLLPELPSTRERTGTPLP